ncbi:TPA: 5-methyltetrahydropteroyltriglutamate--homocysteine S-methyltransferase, partial [Neisseria meningitidis]
MTTLHFSGFPRVGAFRELKFAQEKYWRKEISEQELLAVAKDLREKNWKHQVAANADFVAVGDFTFYDHILDLQVATGAIPARFGFDSQNLSLEQFFQLARGNKDQFAIEMTKWFDTNYHYLVPEFHADTGFKANAKHYVQQLQEAQALGLKAKPTVVGPLTFLWVGKEKGAVEFDRLSLLPKLLPVYVEILTALVEAGAEWIQIDEPALAVDLPKEWVEAYKDVYATLSKVNAKILLSTYFGSVAEHAALLKALPVDGLHIDLVRAPEQLDAFADYDKVLSAGVIDGRNIWRANLNKVLETVEPLQAKLGDRLWISSSCSLLHTPFDLSVEEKLKANKPDLYSWLAFTLQKNQELRVLKAALNEGRDSVAEELAASQAAADSRANSSEIHRADVAKRLADLPANADQRKSPFADRIKAQQAWLNLPLLPTTNIGSFP